MSFCKRICIVEDSGLIAEDFRLTLLETGYEVEAYSGLAALEQPDTWYCRFDAAVVDLDFDTPDCLRALARFSASGVPVALLTGLDPEDLPRPARQHLRIDKPIANARLRAVAQRLTHLSQHPE